MRGSYYITHLGLLYQGCIVVDIDRNIITIASDLRMSYSLSFWDSLIVASALAGGADILYSEDMQDGLRVSGQLNIVNPFDSRELGCG